MSGIYKAYDIRGIYPGQLNEAIAEQIGRAYIEFTGAKKVVVGTGAMRWPPGCRSTRPTWMLSAHA